MRCLVLLVLLSMGCTDEPYRSYDREINRVMDLVQNPRGLKMNMLGVEEKESGLLEPYWANLDSWKVVQTRRVNWRGYYKVSLRSKTGRQGTLTVLFLQRLHGYEVRFFE
jgi:hypothetical protein